MSRQFAVIGMGRLGVSLAGTLAALGHDVLGVDVDKDLIQDLADELHHVQLVAADAAETSVLQDLGLEHFDGAAVVIGGTLLTGGSGSVAGTAAGVLLLAVIQNLIGVHLSQYGSSASDFANGLFLALVVLVQTTLARARRLS